MVILAIFEAVAIIAVVLFSFWLHRDAQKAQRDLLDRLMSRDWGEYRSLKAAENRKARTFSMTDGKEAMIEKMRQV